MGGSTLGGGGGFERGRGGSAASAGRAATTLSTSESAEQVSALWHGASPGAVAETAEVIRAWARAGKRDFGSTDVYRNWWRDQEVMALQTAYRLPAVWMFRAFGAEFESHRHGLHVRDFACYDGLHPNHDGRAESMVSDLIWSALKRGLDSSRTLGTVPLAAARAKVGGTPRYVVSPPLQSLPPRVGHVCFTFDSEGWEMLTGDCWRACWRACLQRLPSLALLPHFALFLHRQQCTRHPARPHCLPPTPRVSLPAASWPFIPPLRLLSHAGSKRTNRKLHEQSLIQTLAAPTITHNAGWSFIVYEPNSRTPFKPGIVTTLPGSRLHFQVDTSRAVAPSISLQYLESKLGMGVVRLECRGCTCAPTLLDATGEVARLSTLVTREVRSALRLIASCHPYTSWPLPPHGPFPS